MRAHLLPRASLTRFTRVRTGRWLGAAVVEWTIIVATLWICHAVGAWWVYPPAILLIGSRQHALGVLAHEGAHHLVSERRRVNDVLSDLLASYPLGFTTVGFRTTHFQHHAYLETAKDPSRITIDLFPQDWTFPMTRRRVAKVIARDLSGLSQASSSKLLKYLWEIPGGRGRHLAQLIAFHVVVVAVLVRLQLIELYLVLWLVPLFTSAIALYRMRAAAEHSGLDSHQIRYMDESADPLSATRTTIHRNRIMKFLLSPYNVSYHIEHHMYPSVPVFELPRLHDQLRQSPDFEARAHVTPGYAGLLRELTTAPG